MKPFEVEIITPSKSAFSGSVLTLTVPGSAGEFQVLFNHAPLMSTFEIGRIKIKTDENEPEKIFITSGGIVEVKGNKILVLADSLENPSEIDVDRAERSAQRARERLANRSDRAIDQDRAEAALARALNRIKMSK